METGGGEGSETGSMMEYGTRGNTVHASRETRNLVIETNIAYVTTKYC